MKKLYSFAVLLVLFVLSHSQVMAQDFVYEPKNPAFGGNPFNYQWLQSSAQSQDKLKDPNATTGTGANQDPLKQFQESLNRQILSQLSRQLVSSQFGDDGLAPGKYVIGTYQIDVTEGTNGISVVIVDQSTGNQTTVTIPYF
ncbi:curli production assembly/transport component CsgF [Rufibacter radiotolerans]|uniref:Curli production assembly/transport component CsgF n=1 Tax=Rufibacter radiotolerans TaxID=1379910 RepID=A0A0H4VIH2_9BACT|nr:curli production assembly/transport component CsgF [Rufibacter radiotolerans]AKQ45188.1 curli production assembly/transport component CsgF [Rufibacter radiotolerans]